MFLTVAGAVVGVALIYIEVTRYDGRAYVLMTGVAFFLGPSFLVALLGDFFKRRR